MVVEDLLELLDRVSGRAVLDLRFAGLEAVEVQKWEGSRL